MEGGGEGKGRSESLCERKGVKSAPPQQFPEYTVDADSQDFSLARFYPGASNNEELGLEGSPRGILGLGPDAWRLRDSGT